MQGVQEARCRGSSLKAIVDAGDIAGGLCAILCGQGAQSVQGLLPASVDGPCCAPECLGTSAPLRVVRFAAGAPILRALSRLLRMEQP